MAEKGGKLLGTQPFFQVKTIKANKHHSPIFKIQAVFSRQGMKHIRSVKTYMLSSIINPELRRQVCSVCTSRFSPLYAYKGNPTCTG